MASAKVGHGSGGINRDFVGILPHQANHEVSGVFSRSLDRGRALGHRRDFAGAVHFAPGGKIPRALIDQLAVNRLPLLHVLFAVNQRKFRAGNHRDIAAADDLHQAQRVLDFLIAPGVAGEHGDAEDVGVRGIDQGEDRLHVRAAGTGGVLVNDYFAFRLSAEADRKRQNCKCKRATAEQPSHRSLPFRC